MTTRLIGVAALAAIIATGALAGCDRGTRTVVVPGAAPSPVVEKDTTVVHDQPVVIQQDPHRHDGPPPGYDDHRPPPPPPGDRH